MNKKLNIVILIISIVGTIFSFWLIYSNIKIPGFCPSVFNIPACNLVLIAFSLILISIFIKNKYLNFIFFFIGDLSGLLLAVWFSYNQFNNKKECPRLFIIPLCYLSLAAFVIILILKIINYRIAIKKG